MILPPVEFPDLTEDSFSLLKFTALSTAQTLVTVRVALLTAYLGSLDSAMANMIDSFNCHNAKGTKVILLPLVFFG